jgi:hypothetical protein
MDGIAGGALHHLRPDLNVPPAAELPCSLAVGALLDRDLVRWRAGPAAVRTALATSSTAARIAARTAARTAIAVTAATVPAGANPSIAVRPAEQRRDQLVIGEPLPVLLGRELVHGPQEVVRLGRELDRDRLAMEAWLRRIRRQIAGLVPGDHRLHLAEALAARRLEPRRFGLGHRDPRQLARG